MKLKKYLVFVIILIINAYSFGQSSGIDKVGTTSFQFLKVMPDARSTGMGEAFITVVNSSDAVFWNPAALSRVENYDFSSSYVQYFFDVAHISASAAYNWDGIGHFGFQALVTDLGTIPVTTVDNLFRTDEGSYNPGITGETISPGHQVFGISYAKELTDKFSFGLTVKYAIEDLVVENASSIIFEGGLLYNTGYKSIVVGAALRHFGPEVEYFDQSYPLPQTFTIGISSELVSDFDPLLLKVDDQKLLFAYNLSQPRDYSQQHHLGLEYAFGNMFFLRSGYKINFDEEGLTLGAGISYSGIRVDYSYNDFGEYLGSVHRFTVGFGTN
jgi:hypothetical protein